MADVRGVYAAIANLGGTDVKRAAIELCRFVNQKDAMTYLFDRYGVTTKNLPVVALNWTAEVLDDVSPKKLRESGVKMVEAGKVFERRGDTFLVQVGVTEDVFKAALQKELKG